MILHYANSCSTTVCTCLLTDPRVCISSDSAHPSTTLVADLMTYYDAVIDIANDFKINPKTGHYGDSQHYIEQVRSTN